MTNKRGITVRFDLENKEDLKAWNCLHGLASRKYKSLSKMIIAAVNDSFGCAQYTDRESIEETVSAALKKAMPQALSDGVVVLLNSAVKTVSNGECADASTLQPYLQTQGKAKAPSKNAMDFVNSF